MKRLFLADANVLIDYIKADREVLRLVVHHIGQVLVPTVIASEVRDASAADLKKLGLRLVEPTLEQIAETAPGSKKLSRNDLLVFAMARDHRCTCITNDKLLRAHCKRGQVETVGGLRLMLDLCAQGHMDPASARATLERITTQSRRIATSVLESFERELRRIEDE